MFSSVYKHLASSPAPSPDGVYPAVPLVGAGCAQLVGLVFPLHHLAFALRLAGLDLLSSGVIQLQTVLFKDMGR